MKVDNLIKRVREGADTFGIVESTLHEGVGYKVVDSNAMKRLGISDADIKKTVKIVDDIARKVGDKGSVVLGAALTANGHEIVTAYSQGNLGPEKCYREVQQYLVSKYPKIGFTIKYGRMD